MVFQQLIRYAPDPVGLKPLAMGSQARLRGLERIMHWKTTTSSPQGGAGAWGDPVSPYVHIRPHSRGAQRQHEMKRVETQRRCVSTPKPSRQGGRGKTRFPHMFVLDDSEWLKEALRGDHPR